VLSSIFWVNRSGTALPQFVFFASFYGQLGADRVIITDKLRSYGAAKRVVMPGVAHRQHRYLNNRAENSHQPTRERERRMRRFKSGRHAQGFVEVHGIVASHFRPRRHLLSAADYEKFAANDPGFGMK
jgi:transposase-like protein